MNEQWRKAIRHRNKLWKQFIRERNDTDYASYKVQRNKCTSLRRKAIKNYFLKKTKADNPREFWNAYRPFIHSRKSKQAKDILLKEQNTVISDKQQIGTHSTITLLILRTEHLKLMNMTLERTSLNIQV